MSDIEGAGWRVMFGSCLDRLKDLEDNSVDSVVTDPPYELGFMGKSWDSSGIAYNVDVWRECLRVLKPGGHVLAFGGSRTWHRLAVAVEDAGFEIRDSIAWIYGSGFPKSLDVSKAIDKAAGVQGELIGERTFGKTSTGQNNGWNTNNVAATGKQDVFAPATPEAVKWQGWGTALKPAFEPVVVGRKPLTGTVAANVLEWGVGGLNIDGSRIGSDEIKTQAKPKGSSFTSVGKGQGFNGVGESTHTGRWPSNVVLDDFTAKLLDKQSGEEFSRFFYVAKTSKSDRNEGLEELEDAAAAEMVARVEGSAGMNSPRAGAGRTSGAKNFHPTVKPTALMRKLVKLVTPPNGVVLDPFTGSGSTGKAALLERFQFVGIELTEEYLPIIEGRLNATAEAVYKDQMETLFDITDVA
jgi:site-specific DNA-methyltransferase (adenine-specific)